MPRTTLKTHQTRTINFITPEEDTAPMDFGNWNISKRTASEEKRKILIGLRKALKQEWGNRDQNMINKSLNSRPKCCQMIYYCHGSQIDHLRKYRNE